MKKNVESTNFFFQLHLRYLNVGETENDIVPNTFVLFTIFQNQGMFMISVENMRKLVLIYPLRITLKDTHPLPSGHQNSAYSSNHA